MVFAIGIFETAYIQFYKDAVNSLFFLKKLKKGKACYSTGFSDSLSKTVAFYSFPDLSDKEKFCFHF